MKSSTTWNGNAIAQSPRKMSEFRDNSNTSDHGDIRFLMVYRTIVDVILHLFIICKDFWCQLPFFFLQTFRFGTMPPMCRGCPDVNKLRGMDTTILGQHWPFMSIKSFVQHSGWQEKVSLSRWAIGGRWLQSPASQDGDGGKPDFGKGHFWPCYRDWIVAIFGMRAGIGYS